MKTYLFTPGPVSVPEEVLLQMAKPIIHHRTEEFEGIFAEVRDGLKYVYGTQKEKIYWCTLLESSRRVYTFIFFFIMHYWETCL